MSYQHLQDMIVIKVIIDNIMQVNLNHQQGVRDSDLRKLGSYERIIRALSMGQSPELEESLITHLPVTDLSLKVRPGDEVWVLLRYVDLQINNQ